MSALLDAPALALAAAIRRKEVSPVELVRAFIRRIEAVNPALNAVVARCFGRALTDAWAAERRALRPGPGDLPPLLGVPFTVKECISVADMPWTAGLKGRVGRVGLRDAPAVTRLRQAGAVLLGTTNLPELALWYESYNKVYGRTSNPWDLKRTCGGSSGGEAAIIAAGGSPMGLGSDAGGSIRVPAAFCGIVGHKPSGRRVPGTGHAPTLAGGLGPIAQIGPMGRTVGDVRFLLNLISGPDGEDPDVRPMAPAEADLPKDLRVFFSDGLDGAKAQPEIVQGVTAATRALAERGAHVEAWKPGSLGAAAEVFAAGLHALSAETFTQQLGLKSQAGLAWELVKLPLGLARFTAPSLVVALIEDASLRLRRTLAAGAEERDRGVVELSRLLGDDGVLVAPVYPEVAPRHGQTLGQPLGGLLAALFNALEAPATAVPVGFSSTGMPLGVQIVARPGNDGLALAAAHAVEESLGGWTRAEAPTTAPSEDPRFAPREGRRARPGAQSDPEGPPAPEAEALVREASTR